MLSETTLVKQTHKLFALILAAVQLAACGIATPVPTITATTEPDLTTFTPSVTSSPIHTITPSPANTLTATPEPDTPPGCIIINENGKLYVISDKAFFALGPTAKEIDQALAGNFPEWANYKQTVRWDTEPAKLCEIVREASFQEKFTLNSAVTLVTLGESLDWQLPSDSDLFMQSLTISKKLHHLWFEWTNPENEHIRDQHPEVTNAATYAVYAFFDYDDVRLRAWHDAYRQLFGDDPSQPLVSTFLQSSATSLEPFLARPFHNPDGSFYTVNSFFDHQYPRYEGEGVGVVGYEELVSAYGRENVRELTAEAVMREGVPELPADIPLTAAAQLMQDQGIRVAYMNHNSAGIIYPAAMISYRHIVRHLAASSEDELKDLGIAAERKSPLETFAERREAARRRAGLQM